MSNATIPVSNRWAALAAKPAAPAEPIVKACAGTAPTLAPMKMADVKTAATGKSGGAAYVPPSQRKKEEQQLTSLDTNNDTLFPTLGGTTATSAPTPKASTVDFKQTVLDRIAKDKEEADLLALPPEEDPLKMTKEELIAAGFDILSLGSVSGLKFNERLAASSEQVPEGDVYEDGPCLMYDELLRVAAAPTLYEGIYGYPPVYDPVTNQYVVRREDYVLTLKKKVDRPPTMFELAMKRKAEKARAARAVEAV